MLDIISTGVHKNTTSCHTLLGCIGTYSHLPTKTSFADHFYNKNIYLNVKYSFVQRPHHTLM